MNIVDRYESPKNYFDELKPGDAIITHFKSSYGSLWRGNIFHSLKDCNHPGEKCTVFRTCPSKGYALYVEHPDKSISTVCMSCIYDIFGREIRRKIHD